MANWKVSFKVEENSYKANVKADTENDAIKELTDHWKHISEFPVNIIEVKKINHPQ